MDSAVAHLRFVECHGNDVKHDVPLRDCKVVQHADVRHLDSGLPDELAPGSYLEESDVVAAVAVGLIAEGHHIARFRIDLRVCRKRTAR